MKSLGSLRLRQFFLAATLLLVCQPALAEKRVALVLGNSAYQNVPRLPNPVNDGAVIAATLKDAGFDVVDSRHDLPAAETRRALRDFADRARDADIAVVYYAGHGMEVDGTNYLIPVDAKLERDTDVYDEAFSLDRVLLAIEPAKRCRGVFSPGWVAAAEQPRQAIAARDSGCLPRQSVRQEHETDAGIARDQPGSRQGRADQPEHADRLFRQGRLHGCGRRRQEQPVHGCTLKVSDDAGA